MCARAEGISRTVLAFAADAAETFLELIAPTRCAGCEVPGTVLCEACLASIARVAPASACPRCGAPRADRRHDCGECRGRSFAFGEARCAALLAHPLSRAVTLHKDGGERRLRVPLGLLVAEAAGEWAEWAEAVTFVPASRAALSRRGFDHAEAIAAEAAAALTLPCRRLLVRRGGADQRRLGRTAREANAASAFAPIPAPGRFPRRVLLVDDVLTTGSTLSACARVLLDVGCEGVRAAAVARAVDPAAARRSLARPVLESPLLPLGSVVADASAP